MKQSLHPWRDPPNPGRGDYPHNVGGALAYYAALFVRNITSLLGDTIADILSSVFTRFLALIEPEMLDYVGPMVDDLLAIPDLPAGYRAFLTQVRHPSAEAGAGLLGVVASTFGGVATSSILDVLMTTPRRWLMKMRRPTLPPPGDAVAMAYRHPERTAEVREVLAVSGIPDSTIDLMFDLLRQRPDVGTLIQWQYRNPNWQPVVVDELRHRGMTDDDINKVLEVSKRMLDVDDVITGWRRKLYDEGEMDVRLRALGYGDLERSIIKRNAAAIPSWNEITRMAVRDAWRDDIAARWGYDEDFPAQAAEWGEKLGYSQDWLRRYWRAHWELPSPQMIFEMMHRKVITPEQADEALKVADYPAGWRQRLMKISYAPYTRVDVRRMYGLGVLTTRDEVKRAYMDIGYDDDKAEHLTEFTVRYEDDDGSNKLAKYKELTQSQLSKAFRGGHIDETEYRTQLSRIKYTPDDIEWLVGFNEFQAALDLTPDLRKEYRDAMATALERAYTKRIISDAQLKQYLVRIGYSDQDCEYIISHAEYAAGEADLEARVKAVRSQYVAGLIDDNQAVAALGQLNVPGDMQNLTLREWAYDKDVRVGQLTEAKLNELMRYEVVDLDTYCNELRNLGYNERYVLWLRALWIKKQHLAAAA